MLRKLLLVVFSCVAIAGYADNRQTYSASWTEDEVRAANTVGSATYMSQLERDVMICINLARLYPRKFAQIEVAPYGKQMTSPSFPQYKQSLMQTLQTMEPVSAIVPAYEYYLSAYCWAEESGRLGIIGHARVECEKVNVAECCSYGVCTPMDITLQWLIDDNVASLGHRINCLSPRYTQGGVAHMPHKVWKYCTVLDIIW